MYINAHFLTIVHFSIQCPRVQGCLHHWMWSSGLQLQRCHLNPRYHSMMKFDGLNMDIVHVVMNVYGYIDVCQGFLPYPSVHH